MSQPAMSVNLGFLTVQRDPSGYVGGYLVTNLWGRPLEFRLSSPVQANKVQQILYGATLEPYLCSDLIGKKLMEKTATPAQFIFTDHPAVLDLRLHVAVPVGLLLVDVPASTGSPRDEDLAKPGVSQLAVSENLACHGRFADDVAALRALTDQLGSTFDLSDAFLRIRDALAEARKLGVANRAA